MDKKWLYLILVVVVIGFIAAGYFYYSRGGKIPFIGQEEKEAAVEVKEGLGAKALEKTNNPLSGELPETNPFNVNTNPFK